MKFLALLPLFWLVWPLQAKVWLLSSHRMGSGFVYTVAGPDSSQAMAALHAADAEVARIEALISSWQPTSQTSEVNRQAGVVPVVVDKKLFDLVARAIRVSELTGGAFDITFAGISQIWKFDGTMTSLPDSAAVAASVHLIDYRKIQLNRESSSIFLSEAGMKMSFGAIGKGYAADRAKAVLLERGFASGVVNAGGDLICWGEESPGKPWRISIADPFRPDRILATLVPGDQAVVTSGNYERYAFLKGRRYAHIIDPRTGWPAEGLRSVTVVAPFAEAADALATALFVLGETEALALVEQLKGVECLLVTDDLRVVASSGLVLEAFSADAYPDTDLNIGGKKP